MVGNGDNTGSKDNIRLINCISVDAGAEGIAFRYGNNQFGNGNRVHGGETANDVDYHFLIGNGTTNSTFLNTKVYREGTVGNEPDHFGHGIVHKCNDSANPCSNNLVDGFEIYNTFLEYQFPQAQNNKAINGKLIRTPGFDGTTTSGGINIKNGADFQTFENIYIENAQIRILNQADGASGWEADSSDNNTFKNIIIDNTGYTFTRHIHFSHVNTNNETFQANNNKFINCTFKGGRALFMSNHAAPGTELINCNIDDVDDLTFNHWDPSTYPGVALTVTYDHCNFTGNGFSTPSGTSITNHSSGFDSGVGELGFKLLSTSSLINIGKTGTGNNTDFGEFTRDATPDIGAWEFGGTIPPVVSDLVGGGKKQNSISLIIN